MKMTIEVDCTPEEARRFMGLPDVAPLNERLVSEMAKQVSALSPEEVMKSWMAVGSGAQDQFRKMMEAGLSSGLGAGGPAAKP
jgi:hypothetical protein